MHILLTDITSCPRCGPEFGLILLVEEMLGERRVGTGSLGCSNCRERYAIREAVADLRFGEPGWHDGGTVLGPTAVERLVALAGVHGRGYLFCAGPAAEHAEAIAQRVPDANVLAAFAAEPPQDIENASVLQVARSLPFYSGRIAGVVLSGGAAGALLEEGARVLGPTGRLVLEPAPPDVAERLARAGLRVLAAQGPTVVAARGTP